jgi:hypothetical protein
MDATEPIIRFVGDLHDPWVQELLRAISDVTSLHAVMCTGEIPDRLFDPSQPPRLLIMHRNQLSQADAARIGAWRSVTNPVPMPRTILCYSPYVRYAELERCSRCVDLMIAEATAVETLGRHVSRLLEPRGAGTGEAALAADCLPVRVISSDWELRAVLTEVCIAEGFKVASEREFETSRRGPTAAAERQPGQVLTIWDIPLLEPSWPKWLENHAKRGPVLGLLGFADRAAVRQARASGALACLDLPVDVHDLVHVLLRVNRTWRSNSTSTGSSRIEPAHIAPPAPLIRARPGKAAIRRLATCRPLWSEGESPPTIDNEKPD